MKLNIELDNLDEASVVLAALQALKGSVAPVAMPMAEAPVADTPVADVPVATPAPDKDRDGLPWDERIHSSNHKLNADGRWQRRRNVDDAVFEQVKSELLGTPAPVEPVALIAPTPLPDFQPTPLTMNKPDLGTITPLAAVEPSEQPVIAPTVIPAGVEPIPVGVEQPLPEKSADDLYTEMFAKLQAAFQSKKIDANYIQNTLTTLNAMFGKNWTGLGEIKNDVNALKFVIDQLTKEGM